MRRILLALSAVPVALAVWLAPLAIATLLLGPSLALLPEHVVAQEQEEDLSDIIVFIPVDGEITELVALR